MSIRPVQHQQLSFTLELVIVFGDLVFQEKLAAPSYGTGHVRGGRKLPKSDFFQISIPREVCPFVYQFLWGLVWASITSTCHRKRTLLAVWTFRTPKQLCRGCFTDTETCLRLNLIFSFLHLRSESSISDQPVVILFALTTLNFLVVN